MLVKIYGDNPSERELKRVVEALERDGIVIYPTDSVYAFGCSLRSAKAVERLRRLRGRSEAPLTVVFHDIAQVAEYCRVDNTTFRILKRNLPGPFTFLLPASSRCPMITASVKDDDEVVEYTTDPELIEERYGREVSLVIDGGMGDNVPTTIVDLTGDEPEIVREGRAELQ